MHHSRNEHLIAHNKFVSNSSNPTSIRLIRSIPHIPKSINSNISKWYTTTSNKRRFPE